MVARKQNSREEGKLGLISFEHIWQNFENLCSVQVREIDNRGSNFYLALYWAEELAKKDASWQVKSQLEERS